MNAAQPTRYPVKPQPIIAPVFAAAHVSPKVEEALGRAMAFQAMYDRNIRAGRSPEEAVRKELMTSVERKKAAIVRLLRASPKALTNDKICALLQISIGRGRRLLIDLYRDGAVTRWRGHRSEPYRYKAAQEAAE